MKRIQALLLLIILLLAPFLKAPAYFFCSMRPGAPKAACCCPTPSGAPSSCCRVIPVPLGERVVTTAPPVVTAPDLVGLVALALPAHMPSMVPDRELRRTDHAPPWPPDRPLFLLHSSFLS